MMNSSILRLLNRFSKINLCDTCTLRYYSLNQANRRVVVTGLGCVTPLGVGVERNWSKLIAGETGIKPIRDKDAFGSIKSAGFMEEEELNLASKFSKSELRTLSLATLYALMAADEALNDAKLIERDRDDCIGAVIGQGMVDQEYIATSVQKGKLSPHYVTRILPNMAGGHVAIKHNLKGINVCPTSACASGLHAIGLSFILIQAGVSDVILAGATEACLDKISVEAFARMRALSTRESNDRPSRPFDKNRDGFVIGEGCGLLVLEELDSALKRGADIKAEIIGFGSSCDAHHVTQPETDGAKRSIEAAIKSLSSDANEISYINAHATSTPLGDENELRACSQVLNDTGNICISSSKGAIGHLLGASGSVEALYTVLACQKGVIPPSINIVDQMDSDFNIVKSSTKWNSVNRVALKNSFGFGGTNASLLIKNYR